MQATIFARPHRLTGFVLSSMMILCATVAPSPVPAAADDEAVILTPPPPATPRINGAKIFGVRPGHPFLFTIPATGQRPMEFAVDGLPAGLKVDLQTGQITGSLAARGEYVVTFHAKNALGEAKRTFKIVCGDTLALTPHMGWNSWYIWTDRVTDKILRDAADAMVASGMIQHGYMYVNVDDCWAVNPKSADPTYGGQPRNAQGNVNSNKRFPDMKALADYIHGKGLKAGLYTSPGPLTCDGCVGAYQHEEQDARQFAAWGFDFLKYDWCSYGEHCSASRSGRLAEALSENGRHPQETRSRRGAELLPIRHGRRLAVGTRGGRSQLADRRRPGQ